MNAVLATVYLLWKGIVKDRKTSLIIIPWLKAIHGGSVRLEDNITKT